MPLSPGRPAWLTALLFPVALGRQTGAAPEIRVGGQAVIEGVMMRGPARWAVAVRQPDGRIVGAAAACRPWSARRPFLGRPFLRGAVVLAESLLLGLKALNYSAEIAAAAEKSQDAPTTQPALGFWALALTFAASLGLALALFVAAPHLLSLWLGRAWGFDETSAWFHLLDGLIKFALFLGYVWGIGLIPEIGRVYAYHGAEHQAIFAFEAGETPLTPDSAARYPLAHPRCGTAFIFLVLALSILFFAAVFPLFFTAGTGPAWLRAGAGLGLKILLLPLLAGLAYEVTRLAGRAPARSVWRLVSLPGLWLQRLTTRRPDASQLEVALHALNQASGA